MIYLDSAATALSRPACVAEAMLAAIQSFGNPSRGAYPASLEAARTVYAARCKLAALLGCPRADHVVFTCNATEALNIAIYGLLAPGEHAVSTDLEHNSVLRPLYDLQARGLRLDFVPADRQGRVAYADFDRLTRPDTKAVICTHASNLTGNALDIRRIAALAHSRDALLIVDAAQTAGALPLNMTEMGIDLLCVTGHKGLLGPQGTGALLIRPGVELRPFKRGGSGVQSHDPDQPRDYPTRLEAGTLNAHGIAGLGAALDHIAATGQGRLFALAQERMWQFYEAVSTMDGVSVYGDFSEPIRAPIVSLNLRGMDAAELADRLSTDYEIAVRAGAHCAPRMHRALGTEACGAVRFSFSPFTTPEEIETAIKAVRALAAEANESHLPHSVKE
ncbi:MAG: aminotransferase class V-fold PLP-dependent enzyme [Oscillospiraceae bacterium]|nr:aminotransferase class V-fold PLP-dependent enzyme [Oscillospiraceae bacterium]